MTNSREELEGELNDLDIPIIMADAAIMILGDALDIDPLTVLTALMSEPRDLADLRTAHGENDVNLMVDMIEEGIESSTQLTHLARAIQLHRALEDL